VRTQQDQSSPPQVPALNEALSAVSAKSGSLREKRSLLEAEIQSAFDRLIAAVEVRRKKVLQDLADHEERKQAVLGE